MSTIVCSHGFGVRADGRGMFTEIQAAFPEHDFVMFDYNEVLESGDLVVTPIDKQVERLNNVLSGVDDVILLGHSQGCIIAAMSDATQVNQVILLAPPVEMSMQRVIDKLLRKPGATIDLVGISKLPRNDGTTTHITRQYIESVNAINPFNLYSTLASDLPTTIIRATNDNVLGLTNVDEVPGVKCIDLFADHDFKGEARKSLIDTLRTIIG